MATAVVATIGKRLSPMGFRIVPRSKYKFFLDVDPEEAYRRTKQTRSVTEMFENLESLKLIHKKALYLVLNGKWKIIVRNRPEKAVENEIMTNLGLRAQQEGTLTRIDAR